MKTYFESLLTLIKKKQPEVIYLEGGYFNTKLGATNFSLCSLKDAITLAEKISKISNFRCKIVFGMFINNIGQSSFAPSLDSLPDTLKTTINSSPIFQKKHFWFFTENNAKNRGKKSIKKLHSQHPDLFDEIKINDAIKLNLSSQEKEPISVAKLADNVYTVYCPWIMAQHYTDIANTLTKHFHSSTHFLIVDWVEMFERSKVIAGTRIFMKQLKLFTMPKKTISIATVFFADDEGIVHELAINGGSYE